MINCPKILVCTDFSAASYRALKVADAFSKKTRGELHLLHVAEIGLYFNASGSSVRTEDIDKGLTTLIRTDLLARMNEQVESCDAHASVIVHFDSSALKNILHTVVELGIDLIVMGDLGATGLEQFMLGSLARKVVTASPKPVLIVKDVSAMDKMAALVDGMDDAQAIVGLATEFSSVNSAELMVVSLVKDEKTRAIRKEQMGQQLAGRAVHVLVDVSDKNNISSQLVALLHENHIKLAVLKRRNQDYQNRYVLGSVSNRVLEFYEGNVLVC